MELKGGALAFDITFVHVLKVETPHYEKCCKNTIIVRRGPLLFSLPVPSVTTQTSLNGSWIVQTSHELDKNSTWQLGIDNSSSMKFSGFRPTSPIPFDIRYPAASVTVTARVVRGWCPRGPDKCSAIPPASPVPAQDQNGSSINVDLVPLANTNLRLTVLPVLA